MKHHLFSSLLLLCLPLLVTAQDTTLDMLEGVSHRGEQHFEISGYSVSVKTRKMQFGDKAINKIKSELKSKKEVKIVSNPSIETPHAILVSEITDKDRPKVVGQSISYLFEKPDKKTDVIQFVTLNPRNTTVEKTFIDAYIANELDKYILTDLTAGKINLVGRTITLGDACQIRSPHNIYCKGGQISWSEFDSEEQARTDINNRILSNDGRYTWIQADTLIDVTFEGQPTQARRIVYRTLYDGPKQMMNKYPLIVYYVATKVRDRYISCIMSNYGYNKDDYELAPLLKQVMEIDSIPVNAFHEFDKPAKDVLSNEDEQAVKQQSKKLPRYYSFALRAGAYQPLGKLSSALSTSPYLGLKLTAIPSPEIRISAAFDVTIPSGRKEFDYYLSDNTLRAKTEGIMSLNLQVAHEKQIGSGWSWDKYFGLGVGVLSTNQEKPGKKKNDNERYYDVATFNIKLGLSLYYKSTGIFTEFNYSPYGNSKHIKGKLSGSAIVAGLILRY